MAVVDDRVVGTLQLTFLPGLPAAVPCAQIEAVRIAADLRGTGLGTELFGWAVDATRRRGYKLPL